MIKPKSIFGQKSNLQIDHTDELNKQASLFPARHSCLHPFLDPNNSLLRGEMG